ncbi:glycosyltransferase [Streptomyces avicenniae]|uniref:glycosyltransferase n=1 Tax=Streptomyces avicenniae TaxID=500153 RepID=UPI00069C887A|nr:glycosyltransferase [Streptomyces avicenniae]
MRVLCTAIGSPSHGRALLPVARALAGAGHDVTVATTDAVAPVFAQDDVTVSVCMPPLVLLPQEEGAGGGPPGREEDAHIPMMIDVLAGTYAPEGLRVLSAAAREVRPDLLIRDGMDLASCLLAERLGVAQVPFPSGFANVADPARIVWALGGARERLGLAPDDDPASLHPHGRLDYLPPDYAFAAHPAPVLAYRQTTAVARAAALPGWVARLPADRPLVVAAFGTALPMVRTMTEDGRMPEGMTDPVAALAAVVAALSRLRCAAVVATGGIPLVGVEPGRHVHLTERIAQPLLLECADLFVHHGGYNGVREAVRTGTPMAVLPHFGDQYHNARRVEELGLGVRPADTRPAALAATLERLLADTETAARVRRAQRAVLALPDLGRAPADLEALAARVRGTAAVPPPAAARL